VGRYQRINGSGREPGQGDPAPPVSDSLSSGEVACVNWGWLAVLEAQRAETCPDLEARTGSSAEGRTTQDPAVYSSTDRNGETVAGEFTEEQSAISLL